MSVAPGEAEGALRQIDDVLAKYAREESLALVCEVLRSTFAHYRWVGVYLLHGDVLDLAGWDGPAATEHTQIPIARGVCGQAAREGRTVIVEDVRSAPEYLACFLETRSEIVVPIRDGRTILGEIDIDGNEVAAFDASDRAFLEQVADRLSASWVAD